jgi:hypothetical protein
MFVNVISSIRDAYPDMAKPLMAGSPSGEIGIGTNFKGDASDPCTEQKGIIDRTNTAELSIGKPIGGCGKGHRTCLLSCFDNPDRTQVRQNKLKIYKLEWVCVHTH